MPHRLVSEVYALIFPLNLRQLLAFVTACLIPAVLPQGALSAPAESLKTAQPVVSKPVPARDLAKVDPKSTAAKEPAKTGAKPTSSKASLQKPPAPKRLLVPPPPPHIPLVPGAMGPQSFSTIGVPLDYLSKAELEKMKVRLESSVSKLDTEKQEADKLRQEKIDRLSQFESLHKEGVVSKRELDAAKRELKSLQSEDDELGLRLDDAKTDLKRVTQQLKSLEKRSSNKKL